MHSLSTRTRMTTSQNDNRGANFTVCASTTSPRSEKWNLEGDPHLSKIHGRLLQLFGADSRQSDDGEDLFDLLWHYGDEPCYIQRPLRDLNDMSQKVLNRRVVQLHSYCLTAARAESLMEQDIAQEGARQETRSMSDRVGMQVVEDTDQQRNTKQRAGDSQAAETLNTARMRSENLANQLERNGIVEDNPEAKSDDEVDEITMSVRFKCNVTQIPLEGPQWNDEALLVGLDWTFTNVTDFLRDETMGKIRTSREKFDEYPKEILFLPTIQRNGEQGRFAKFDIYGGIQIERLDDLFPHGSQDTKLPILVWICTNDSLCPGTAEDKWCDFFMTPGEYYEISELSSAAAVALKSPPTKHAVLGYFNGEGAFELSLIPIWFANGQWLGYAHTSMKIVTDATKATEAPKATIPAIIPKKTQVDKRYNMTSGTTLAIENFLRKDQDAEMPKGLVAGLPFSPFYSFKTLSEYNSVPGLEDWPQHPVYLVGPFKNYLNQSDPVLGGFRIEVRKEHRLPDIRALLNDQLRQTYHGKTLFLGDRLKTWEYCLWILPQSSNGRKLLKCEDGQLMSYMNAERLKVEEELYMEAHLVPTDESVRT